MRWRSPCSKGCWTARAHLHRHAVPARIAPQTASDRKWGGMGVDVESAPGRDGESPGTYLLIAGLLGALVAVTAGVYGNVHNPASDLSITLGFKNTITMKVWLASASALFALTQVTSALWMYGKL